MARSRAWADLRFSAAIASSGNMAPLDILFDLGTSRLDTITVTRLVGDIYGIYDPSFAENEGISRVDVGIGVSPQAPFLVVQVPEPDVTTEYPIRGWMYVATMWVSCIGDTNPQIDRGHLHFDIRTMRKVDKGILYVAAANNIVSGVGTTIRVGGRIRALCLT